MAVITLDTFTFPEGITWPNKRAFSPQVGRVETLITGRLAFQTATLSFGRPIILESGGLAEGYCGLFTAAQADALKALYDAPDQVRTLTIGADVFSVRFDRGGGTGLEVEALAPIAAGYDWSQRIYRVTARFLTVA
jgi:hypothetical protein